MNRLSKPLQSRFRKLFLPRYTEEKFLDVSEKILPKLSSSLAMYIGASVWKNGGDMRDVISIAKLVRKSDGPEQIGLCSFKAALYRRLFPSLVLLHPKLFGQLVYPLILQFDLLA